jgi:hypothetical protein
LLNLPNRSDSSIRAGQLDFTQPCQEGKCLGVMAVESGKTLVSDGDSQGIAVRKQTQQPNLLHGLDERKHATPGARSPVLPIRHIVSDDVDLISQPRDLDEECSRTFGILLIPTEHIARIAANIAPNIVHPAIQSAPHGR